MSLKNMTLENIAKACNGIYIGDESLNKLKLQVLKKTAV